MIALFYPNIVFVIASYHSSNLQYRFPSLPNNRHYVDIGNYFYNVSIREPPIHPGDGMLREIAMDCCQRFIFEYENMVNGLSWIDKQNLSYKGLASTIQVAKKGLIWFSMHGVDLIFLQTGFGISFARDMIRRKIFVVGKNNGSSAIMLELFAFFSTSPLDFQIRVDLNHPHSAITLYSVQWNLWKSNKRHDQFKTMKNIKDFYNGSLH